MGSMRWELSRLFARSFMREYLLDEVNTYYAILTIALVALFAGFVLLQAVRLNTFEIVVIDLPAAGE